MRLKVILLTSLVAAFLLPTAMPAKSAGEPAVKRSSSTIAITHDGSTLLVVNPDSNSLSILSPAAPTDVKEIPVGMDPRSVSLSPSGTTAYVANQGSDSLSLISLAALTVTAEIAVGNRPVGVVASPDGRFVAVAELGDDQIRFMNAMDMSTLSIVAVSDRPYGLTFTPNGRRLLITHLLGGDVTVLDVQPYIVHLPLVFRPQDLLNTQWRMDGHPLPFAASRLSVVSTWLNVAPGPSVVVNATGTRAYLPQTMANGQKLNTQFDTTVFPKVSVLDLQTLSHKTSEHVSLPETDQPVGLPWDLALARDDHELWVVNAASNDISVLNIDTPTQPSRAAHIPVGDNPRGIVLSPDGLTAYVNNTLAGTVSVIDAQNYTVTAVVKVTNIPLPPTLLRGKQLFNTSARTDLAMARWISCNTCHVEGEHDGRTWLLPYTGSVPPGARAVITRNTTSLLGMVETYPLRWSAEWDESADSEFSVRFEQFGTGLIHDGDMNPPLGSPNQGRSYDLDSLAAYIDSLSAPQRMHVLTPSERQGRSIFESSPAGCSTCHPAPLYTDHQVHDVGTADKNGEWLGPLIDTPSLRFLYDSAPYLHDGSAANIRDVLTTANPNDEHGVASHLTEDDLVDLVAFLLALPYFEPSQ